MSSSLLVNCPGAATNNRPRQATTRAKIINDQEQTLCGNPLVAFAQVMLALRDFVRQMVSSVHKCLEVSDGFSRIERQSSGQPFTPDTPSAYKLLRTTGNAHDAGAAGFRVDFEAGLKVVPQGSQDLECLQYR